MVKYWFIDAHIISIQNKKATSNSSLSLPASDQVLMAIHVFSCYSFYIAFDLAAMSAGSSS